LSRSTFLSLALADEVTSACVPIRKNVSRKALAAGNSPAKTGGERLAAHMNSGIQTDSERGVRPTTQKMRAK